MRHLLWHRKQSQARDVSCRSGWWISSSFCLCRQKLGFHCCAQWLWAAATGARQQPGVFVPRREDVSAAGERHGQARAADTAPPRRSGARWGRQFAMAGVRWNAPFASFPNLLGWCCKHKSLFFSPLSLSSHRKASVPRHLSRQFDHRFVGPLSRLEHGGKQQRAAPGHAAVHFPTAGPHCVPRRLQELHREGPDRAVHDGGAGECWLAQLKINFHLLLTTDWLSFTKETKSMWIFSLCRVKSAATMDSIPHYSCLIFKFYIYWGWLNWIPKYLNNI